MMKLLGFYFTVTVSIGLHAQEAPLLEQLAQSEAYASAHERSNTHMVVISEPYRSHYASEHSLGQEDFQAKDGLFKQAYFKDLKDFLVAEHQKAQVLQQRPDPYVVVVVLNDTSDFELDDRRIEPAKVISDYLDYRPEFKNVEVIQTPDQIFNLEQRSRTTPPIFEAILAFRQAGPNSTTSFYLMETSPTSIIRQREVLAAYQVLGPKNGITLNIRTTGTNPIAGLVAPALLFSIRAGSLPLNENVYVIRGTHIELKGNQAIIHPAVKQGLDSFKGSYDEISEKWGKKLGMYNTATRYKLLMALTTKTGAQMGPEFVNWTEWMQRSFSWYREHYEKNNASRTPGLTEPKYWDLEGARNIKKLQIVTRYARPGELDRFQYETQKTMAQALLNLSSDGPAIQEGSIQEALKEFPKTAKMIRNQAGMRKISIKGK